MDALARWIAALHDPATAGAAVTDDVRIERYAPIKKGIAALAPAEVHEGLEAAIALLRRSPKVATFALDGEPQIFGDRIEVAYTISVPDFTNGGIWILKLRDDKIAHLQHRPYAI
jgi:hypothetical protein